jgi:hypothetical protein
MGLDFSNPMPSGRITFMSKSVPIAGGWGSAVSLACDVVGAGCIDTASPPTNAMSTRLRLAYHTYGAYDRVAYAFTHNISALASVKVGDMTDAALLAETASSPDDVVGPNGALDTFLGVVGLDCRETLFLSVTEADAKNLIYGLTYQHITDPGFRNFIPLLEAFRVDGWSIGMPTMSIDTSTPRRMLTAYPNYVGARGAQIRLRDQSLTLTYNATDGCGMSEFCNQMVTLGTVAPCTNVV